MKQYRFGGIGSRRFGGALQAVLGQPPRAISGSTVRRWLHEDSIRPRCHRSWIFPRDPAFAVKAGRILDLYARRWNRQPLKADEMEYLDGGNRGGKRVISEIICLLIRYSSP